MNSQSTQLIIDVADTSSSSLPFPVYYKLRDKWNFKVGGGLTINNIKFDAIDSILTDSDTNNYLKKELNGCSYSENIFSTQTSTDCYLKYPL